MKKRVENTRRAKTETVIVLRLPVLSPIRTAASLTLSNDWAPGWHSNRSSDAVRADLRDKPGLTPSLRDPS